jgi:hypothetical protein
MEVLWIFQKLWRTTDYISGAHSLIHFLRTTVTNPENHWGSVPVSDNSLTLFNTSNVA